MLYWVFVSYLPLATRQATQCKHESRWDARPLLCKLVNCKLCRLMVEERQIHKSRTFKWVLDSTTGHVPVELLIFPLNNILRITQLHDFFYCYLLHPSATIAQGHNERRTDTEPRRTFTGSVFVANKLLFLSHAKSCRLEKYAKIFRTFSNHHHHSQHDKG